MRENNRSPNMKKYNSLAVLFILVTTILIPNIMVHQLDDRIISESTNVVNRNGLADMQVYNAISISSDSDFESQGWDGNGSSSNPYIISNLQITNQSDCITIQHTRSYFIIENCEFIGTSNKGIHLDNITNGLVQNCYSYGKPLFAIYSYNFTYRLNYVDDTYLGIYSLGCNNFTLDSNVIYNISGSGLSIVQSYDVSVSNNTLTQTGNNAIVVDASLRINATSNIIDSVVESGIFLKSSEDCKIYNNTMSNGGMRISGTSIDQQIHDVSENTVSGKSVGYYHSQNDFSIDGSIHNQIFLINCTGVNVNSGNFQNLYVGIHIAFSEDCVVTDCIVSDIYWCGAYIYESDNCSIVDSTIGDVYLFGVLISGYESRIINSDIYSCNYGIYLQNAQQCHVEDCTLVDMNYIGCWVDQSDFCFIENNYAENTSLGFGFEDSQNCYLIENNATSMYGSSWEGSGYHIESSFYSHLLNNTITNHDDTGIYLWDSFHSTVIGNTIQGGSLCDMMIYGSENSTIVENKMESSGISIYGGISTHHVAGNLVRGKDLGFFVGLENTTIDLSSYGQVIISEAYNTTFTNGNIQSVYEGIVLAFSFNCTLSDIRVSSAETGIHMYYSDNTTLYANNVRDCSLSGILVSSSFDCTLIHNTVRYNSEDGIRLSISRRCILISNTINDNSGNGISLRDTSNYNVLYSNVFYRNTLPNGYDNGFNNQWDDGVSIGNAWDDYVGTGNYTIDGPSASEDHFPSLYIPPTTTTVTSITTSTTIVTTTSITMGTTSSTSTTTSGHLTTDTSTTSTTVSTTTSPSTTTTTETTQSDSPLTLFLSVALIGFGVIVVVLIVIFKKRT
ncbi:MAG: NosD domain-containing protein [Candidatus Thorarchaeota archaeon]